MQNPLQPLIPAALVWGGKHHAPAEHKIRSFPPLSHIHLLPKCCRPAQSTLPSHGLCSSRSSLTCLQCSPLWKGLSLFLALLLFFLKCFSFLHLFLFPLSNVFSTGITLGKGAEKLLKIYFTSKTVISVGIASTQNFFPRFLLLAFFSYLSKGQGKWVCGTPEDTAARADSAPGSGAAWPCRGMGSELLPLQSQLMDLPWLLHLPAPFFTSRDAPAANSPNRALFLSWKAFSPSQRSLMCTPCLSHSLQGMPQGNNPQAQIQGPCTNHIPTGPSFWKLSILNQFMLAFALLKHLI